MSVTERKHVPEPATVHRLEIFTGAGRRRTWPAEAKARIVAESLAPGATACGVARRHGLSPQQLFAWRREARQRRTADAGGAVPSFVPVLLEPTRDGASPPALVPEVPAVEIEVAGAVVRVRRGADARTLAAVLRAVRASA
jgi:transposase